MRTCRAWRWTGRSGKLDWVDEDGRDRSFTYTLKSTGEAWLTLQCSRPGHVTTTVNAKFTARAQVRVTGFVGAERSDPGKTTDTFKVWPSNADCAASHVGGAAAEMDWEVGWGSWRRLAVTTTEGGQAQVRLTCSRSGFRDAVHVAGFGMPAEKTTVGGVSVRAVSGGGCTADSTPAAGMDQEWDCWGGRGGTLRVAVTAEDAKPGLSLRWPQASVTGGIDVEAAQDDEAFHVFDGRYRRTSTASITCTSDGTAQAPPSEVTTSAVPSEPQSILAVEVRRHPRPHRRIPRQDPAEGRNSEHADRDVRLRRHRRRPPIRHRPLPHDKPVASASTTDRHDDPKTMPRD